MTGNALVAKAGGAGFRSIAGRFGRPESTVFLAVAGRPGAACAVAVPAGGVEAAVLVDRELLVRSAPRRTAH